ncbi:MAG TPA: hypothetical protein VME43_30660 [Bryobacteraceae bacterium]|nr:hypothetical protein [Bryobacteraceae bacterium]
MKSNRLGLAMILVSGFAGAQGVGAQAGAGAAPPLVRASGDGVVYAQPDEAKIDIGVVTQGPPRRRPAPRMRPKPRQYWNGCATFWDPKRRFRPSATL